MTSRRRKSIPGDPRQNNVVSVCPPQTDQSKELIELFNRLQMDDMSTGKAVGKLKKLYEDSERDAFFNHLVFMIQVPLVNGTSKERPNKFDEKILQVISSFAAASLDDVEPSDMNESTVVELPWILRKVFDWLLDHHEVQGSAARLRICMMINWLLKNLGLHAEIDEVLYQKIHDNMIERMQDKVAEIRAQAVTALQRLQDPGDPDCPIIRLYLRHLKVDPSALVRRTVIKCIGASRATLRPILQRTRDVDDQVRKAAYKFIAEKVSIKILSIGEREELLRQGLTDRNQGVQKVVEKEMVPAWLRICNGNIVELLHAIDVGNSDGKTATEICKATFSGVPYEELLDSFKYINPTTKLIPLKKLTPETLTYWKNLISFLRGECEKEDAVRADEHLDKLMPELTPFCHYIRDYVLNYMGKVPKKDNQDEDEEPDEEEIEAYEVAGEFVAKNLIEMTSYFDLGDEVGRQNLCRLCKDLLANRRLHTGFVEPLMKIYNKIQKNVEIRISEVAEIISELRDPLYSTQTQHMQQQPPQQHQQLETIQEEDERMDITFEEMTEKEREEELRRTQAEAKRNEEDLRKKRVLLAKLRLQMNVLKDEMDTAVVDQEFVLAQEKKIEFDRVSDEAKDLLTEIEEATAVQLTPKEPVKKRQVVEHPRAPPPPPSPVQSQSQSQVLTQTQKDDPDMILKSLTILADLLRCQDIESLNPTLQTLLDEFIIPYVRDLNFTLREAAVKALGCACLKSIKVSKRCLMVVLSMAHLDVPVVRCRALQVVVDLLMWHGLSAFISDTTPEDEDDTESDDGLSTFTQDTNVQIANLTQADLNSQGGDSVVTVLCHLLDDSDLEIRTLVAEGLCKLILCGAITSPKLFTRLILMWCNPVNDTNIQMKTVLGMFFPLYASLSRANQDTIEESFMVTMKTLMDAPETSPLAMVNLEDIGLFYLQLTRPEQLQESCRDKTDMSNVHDTLSFTISNFIISTPESFYVKNFVKFLLNLQISSTNFPQLRELKDLYNQMAERLTDKLALKTLEKYGSRLDLFISMDPEDQEDAEGDEDEVVMEQQRRESVGPEGISILGTQMEQTQPHNVTRKRTLFSQTQNTLLDVSMASPALGLRRRSKNRLVTSTQRSDEQLDFFPSSQNSSTQHNNVPSGEVTDARALGRISESSDSEIDFELPTKIIRRNGDPLDESSDEEVIVSGLLKKNASKATERTDDDEGQPETEKENKVQRAEDEIKDQEVAGPSRVPAIVVDTEAATASPILPPKKKATKNKENARTTAEISDADPEFRQPEKISRLDEDEIEVDPAYNSEDDFMSPIQRSRRNRGTRPDLTSTAVKSKSLSSKKKMARKRVSSSSSSTSLKETEKTFEPVSTSKTGTKNRKRFESKNLGGAQNLTEIEEEYEEELNFESPPPRRQSKRNSLDDFIVVVEKEKRKPSKSQERIGKNEKAKGKNTVEVVVQIEQVRRRSTRNSLEGVKGDQAPSSSQGNTKKSAAIDNNEKGSSTEANKSSNRRTLVEGSSQELREKAKKSARKPDQRSPAAVAPTKKADNLKSAKPSRKLNENASKNASQETATIVVESLARKSIRNSTSRTPNSSPALRSGSQDSNQTANDENGGRPRRTPRPTAKLRASLETGLPSQETPNTNENKGARGKRSRVDETPKESLKTTTTSRRKSDVDKNKVDKSLTATTGGEDRVRRILVDKNSASLVPTPSKRKKRN